jgi:hypothetical protein
MMADRWLPCRELARLAEEPLWRTMLELATWVVSDTVAMTPVSPSSDGSPALLRARMLNEFAYCSRLCCLERVQGEFADNADAGACSQTGVG